MSAIVVRGLGWWNLYAPILGIMGFSVVFWSITVVCVVAVFRVVE